MKNIFNKFAFFIALSFVFISCGNLTTSENDDSIPQGKGKITISTDLQNGRSVLPTAIEETTTGLKWELEGTCEGKTYSKIWNDTTSEDGVVTTAYNKMKSDNDLLLDVGTWNFTLKVKNNSGYVLFATKEVSIETGENNLSFEMKEATSSDIANGETVANGSIEFTLNFPKDVVTKGIATLTPYEGTNPDTQDFTANAGTTSQFLSSITYKKEKISAGYYILKIQLQQEGDATTPAVEYINTYSCLIRVAPGLTSYGVYTLDKLAQLYTIKYECYQGNIGNQLTTTSYNAYTSFELPEPTLDGHYFAGWYTRDYTDDGILIDEKFFGNAGETQTINADTTLYAKWKISWDGLKQQIENASGISEFVITENLTATSTITVSKPFKITSDKNVTITRGNSIDGAIFTDAFFKVESAGNLELEGKENSTITLDGGNANESPILATAPLITSSGNLTLTNCTLQNNKNTSTTPGGAIYISAGKFTMNGGIIGEEITESDASTEKQSWQDAATETNHSNYAYAGGGGIYVASGDVTINGGKISYNYTRNPETDCQGKTPENTAAGGGISIVSGSLSLINSEVSYNSGYQGGGIRCYNDNTSNAGTLTLNKTLIKGNTSNPYKGSSFGGGLMVKNFKVTFEETTESTIEQNYSGDGGALFLENTTSTLTNITIQNNSYNPNGYHYGSEVLLWANANVLIDDSNVSIASTEVETRGIFINNNTNTLKLSGGAKLDAPVYLMSGTTVTVAGYLSSNTLPVATITPASYAVGTQVLTADDASLLAQCVDKFALSDETYSIDNDGNIVASNQSSAIILTQAYLDENLKKTNTFNESYYELEAGEYCVSANLTLKYPIQINASGGEVKLYADGNYKISCAEGFYNSANSAMIALPMSAGTLILGGGEGTLTIDGSGISSLMYLVLSQSTLILQDNCTITNGNVTYTAIYVSAGTFTMTGGTITNIHSTKAASEGYGAGIHVLGSSTVVTVSGGSVCNNYNNGTNQGASIYSTNNSITVLGETIPKETLYTYNIVNGQQQNVSASLIEGAYYVSANGDDSNGGLRADDPLLTLSSAIAKANNSDSKTVYIIGELVGEEASYSGFYISDNVGTNDSPINIIGYPDEIDDVLTVGDNAGRRVVYVYSNSYITFKDLTITGGNVNQSGSAMNLIDCTVTLDNVTITGNSSSNGYTFGSNTYYSDGIEVGSNCTLNIIKSSITNNIRVSGASNSPANVTIGTECDVSNIYLVSDSSTCTFDSNMKINGNVYICSTSANPPVPAIYLSSSLSNYSSDNRIIITYEDCSKVENKQLISLKDGANFNLTEEVKKFTLSDTNYTISDEGKVVQNSGGV